MVLQTGRPGFVDQLEFSGGDGHRLLTHGMDGSIRVWDLREHSIVRIWDKDLLIADGSSAFALSSTGNEILFGNGLDVAKVVSVASGKQISGFSPTIDASGDNRFAARTGVSFVAESPDGQWRVAGNGGGSIVAFQQKTNSARMLQREGSAAIKIWFSLDASHALVERFDQSLLFYNFDTGEKRQTPPDFKIEPGTEAALTTNGEVLLTKQAEGEILLSNLATRTAKEFSCRCELPMISGDGSRLAALELVGDVFRRIRVWSTADGHELPSLPTTPLVYRAAINRDGTAIALGGFDGSVSTSTAEGVQSLSEKVRAPSAVRFLSDSTLMVVDAEGGVRSWGMLSSATAMVMRGTSVAHNSLSSTGRFVAGLGADDKVRILNLEDKTVSSTGLTIAEDAYRLMVDEEGDAVTWNTGSIAVDSDALQKAIDALNKGEDLAATGIAGLSRNNFVLYAAARADGWKPVEVCKGNKRDMPRGIFHAGQLFVANCSDTPKIGLTIAGEAHFAASRGEVVAFAESSSILLHHGAETVKIPTSITIPIGMGISPNRKYLAVFSQSQVNLIDLGLQRVVQQWKPATFIHSNVAATTDGDSGIGVADDGTIALIDGTVAVQLYTADGHPQLSLFSIADSQWLVVDQAGRFDTSDIEAAGATLKWRTADALEHLQPIEIFMRDYYTPALLSTVMKGHQDKLPKLTSIASIDNRVQPKVELTSIIPATGDPGRVDVIVHAAIQYQPKHDAQGQPVKNAAGQPVLRASGLSDLRLFRDGELVGSGYVDVSSGCAGAGMQPRRVRGGYIEGALRDCNFTFHDVLLKGATAKTTFSAYAFNQQRIKSVTASLDYRQKPPFKRADPPQAYLIQVGVNRYRDTGCQLRYSVSDAERMSAALASRLQGRYKIEAVTLESPATREGGYGGAGKETIRRQLAQVAAHATPDDMVILSFSGHGYSARSGQFYVLPSDFSGACSGLNEASLTSAISADDLAEWLRPIDAGEITLILDACYSAESVQAGDFKPGPMGSRGLGQVAYDKRMRVLAASQSDAVAHEYDYLGQGLLTYVLTKEGLDERKADWNPVDRKISVGEWLGYAADAVPKFNPTAPEQGGEKAARVEDTSGNLLRRTAAQVPALFDFSKTDLYLIP
jgi:WD40 repeat protein